MKNQTKAKPRGLEVLMGVRPSSREYEKFVHARSERGPHPIPRKRQVKNRFYRLFSPKAGGREVVAESALEEAAIIQAEGTPSVISIQEQPIRILGQVGNKPYATLDLMKQFEGEGEVFYEIKPDAALVELKDGRRAPKHWDYIEAWAREHGVRCEFITDLDLSKDALFIDNWRFLLTFVRIAHEQPNASLEREVTQVVRTQGPMAFGSLRSHIAEPSPQAVYAAAASLLHKGYLTAELHESTFSPLTKIWSDYDA